LKSDFAGPQSRGRRNGSTFARVLDEVESADDPERGAGRAGKLLGYPFATLPPPIEPDASRRRDPTELWDQALDWIAEPQGAANAPGTASAPSADADSIAAELGLTAALTHDQLNRARRRFMWNNHPDRRPDVPRELANRRVAIANMLVDRAQSALARRRRAR